ncbi:Sucrose transporter and related proteins protein [Dioscorea alata]|uniref:Sucrose transporter and related proteins protein n=3 Tax=Dioscorea alata TaxID=55571 RepID=A0ACB7UW19_DIOAL|nr:Sucrose transporter and related proteins protein [Dioscorea alata]KAH7665083.1 Sucrose transporter and related proteins protein [Dioscorea alata]KAH7665087.1 Sucrose transporter and related proteins protein [Dioscorea alata]
MAVPGQQRAAPGHRRVAPALAPAPERVPLRRLMRAAAVACGVQFGWALQLSLLTPYVQELGIAHAWASLVWLCGPLSGLLVQPLAGHMSDRCRSGFGRRRPFIAAGAVTIALAVILIGYSADIGDILGDPRGPVHRPRAVVVFVIGFWLLDVGNNATQGPCRALLADLSGKDHRRTRIANAYFSLFMALACSVNCANLKSAFILDIVLLALTTYISISSVQEIPLSDMGAEHSAEEVQQEAFLWELIGSFRYLTPPIWIVLIVVALTWVGWFPFLLFDTDWMGREIYKGKPNEGHAYHLGVRMGSLGLMLNSVVLGVTSVILERLCRKWGAGLVWGISGILMSFCFGAMLIISYVAETTEYPSSGIPPIGIIVAAVIVFAVLGAPLAITYSIPYAMISTRTEPLRLGQGLAMGILNLAIVVPQVIVSLGSGPWDQLFGGGNSPAFAVAAVAAFCSGLMAIIALPRSSITRARTHK